MNEERKYCKFCGKEKPIKEFCKNGFAIKNICKKCSNEKIKQIRINAKKVNKLESNWDELKKWLEKKINIANVVFLDGNEDEEVKDYVLSRKFMMEETLDKMKEFESGNNE